MVTRVLIIEDDEAIRTELLEWLQFEGYSAVGSENGTRGLQVALEQVPDLIISDINMPGMDGHRVLVELRSHATTAVIPFIFLTASADRDNIRYGMELGAEDYITKPFTNEEVIGAVKAQLARAQMLRKHSDQQLDELRSTLIKTLPHELRTPLVGILGYGEMLAMHADHISPDDIREMASSIVSGGQRLNRLILNYLLYAQLEIDASDPEKRAMYNSGHVDDPDFILAQACNEIAFKYQRNSDLRLDLQGCGAVRISGSDLEKIVTELVDNAFKFSLPQTTVTIATRRSSDAYEIQVVDCGRGMNPQDTGRIGAYTQFGRALCEQQGSGLGLIIAKRLIELYGGFLEIQTKLEQGTTVIVRL